jgi:hypothetical protein
VLDIPRNDASVKRIFSIKNLLIKGLLILGTVYASCQG